MSNVFVIADTHFGHQGILNVPGRRGLFTSIEHHDQTLIDNWNSVVTKRDVIYHLGDVGWGREDYVKSILWKLNGMKYLVAGNHDKPNINRYFQKVFGAKVYQGNVLTHIPIHPQEMYWDINIHGHLHGNKVWKYANDPSMGVLGDEADVRYLCVSCEQVGFTPVNLQDLIKQHMERYGDVIAAYPKKGFRRS